jgi:hypothetical protein
MVHLVYSYSEAPNNPHRESWLIINNELNTFRQRLHTCQLTVSPVSAPVDWQASGLSWELSVKPHHAEYTISETRLCGWHDSKTRNRTMTPPGINAWMIERRTSEHLDNLSSTGKGRKVARDLCPPRRQSLPPVGHGHAPTALGAPGRPAAPERHALAHMCPLAGTWWTRDKESISRWCWRWTVRDGVADRGERRT